jgi:CMP-N-acetylneuraminic acid synthetase
LPVARFPVPIEWAFTRSQDSALRPVIPGAAARRSQDFEKKFYDTGTFVFYGEDHIVGETPVADSDYVSCILPATKAVDIDDEEDLELARALYRGREDPVLR